MGCVGAALRERCRQTAPTAAAAAVAAAAAAASPTLSHGAVTAVAPPLSASLPHQLRLAPSLFTSDLSEQKEKMWDGGAKYSKQDVLVFQNQLELCL